MSRLRRRFPSTVAWAGAESVFLASISVISLLFVVRLVGPTAFGEASLAIVLVSLVDVALSGGIMEALIRHRSADTRTLDTALWTRLLLALAALGACLAGSGLVESLYGPKVMLLFMVYAFTIPLNALSESPSAVLIRKYRTRRLALITIGSRVTTLLGTLALAFSGFEAWSIVLGAIAGSVVNAGALWIRAPRLPRLQFDMYEAKQLLKFGVVIALDSLLWTIATRSFLSLFGLFHGPQAVGFLTLGLKLVEETGAIIHRVAWKICYPLLSETNRAGKSVTQELIRSSRVLSYLTVPLFTGIMLTAPNFIPLIFGSAWLPAIPVVQLLAAIWIVQGIRLLIPSFLKAIGQQNQLITLALLEAALSLGACVVARDQDLVIAVATWGARLLIILPVEVLIVWRRGDFPPFDQFRFAVMPALASLVMAGLVLTALATQPLGIETLVMAVVVGVIGYGLMMVLIDPIFRQLCLSAWSWLRRVRPLRGAEGRG